MLGICHYQILLKQKVLRPLNITWNKDFQCFQQNEFFQRQKQLIIQNLKNSGN